MKNILFLLLTLVFISNTSIAQHSSLTIFSEDGHPFVLLINGIQQNENPAANVRAEKLDHDFYSIKVNFTKKSLKSVEQKELSLKSSDGGNIDAMYVLRGSKKGKFKLELYSVTPVKPNLTKMVDHSVEETIEPKIAETEKTTKEASLVEDSTKVSPSQEEADPEKMKAELATMSSTKLDENKKTGPTGNDVKITQDVDVKIVGNEKTTTTTTTTITTIGRSIQRDVHVDVMTEYVANSNINNKNPDTSCKGVQLTDSDFNDSKKNIVSKPSEGDKLAVAKQIASIACLTSNQVKDIMLLFSSEETKLEFAKFADNRTLDK